MKNAFSNFSELGAAFGKENSNSAVLNDNTKADNSLVYSTNSGRIKQRKQSTQITISDGFARVRRETKGRKGKGVISIAGLGLANKELKILASLLKKTCGSGGSVVDKTIEIQGDKRKLIKSTLEQQGFKVKFIGG